MSNTNGIKVKAQALKNFLNDKGLIIKHTEAIEAISMIETGQCYNVAKEKTIRILKEGEKLTFKEMKEKEFQIEVVIPMDMETLMEGIESVNDSASEQITGSDYALCDIGYEVYPYFYGANSVAIKVTGYIGEIETLQYLEDYEEEEN